MGKWTIGSGRNLDDVGISENEAMYLLANDIKRVTMEASQFKWFKYLSDVRQDVIISMIFNMGIVRFKGFKKMISAILRSDFKQASDEMLNSKWRSQVGKRANDLAIMMESNKYLED